MNVERTGEPAFVIWKSRVLVTPAPELEPVALSLQAFAPEAGVVPVFGQGGERIVAYILEAPDEAAAFAAVHESAPAAVFAELMRELGRYAPGVRTALVRAIAIERWSNRYRYCPACGAGLIWTRDAIAKICTNPTRVHRHFPRLDPAVIVLVSDGERVLLGRAARFPPGFYSTLAGFVEPGESVEAAVRREVYEEAGIAVGAIRYFASEPWPFPRSLMLGFFAEAQSSLIALRDAELEDARWFDVPDLQALVTHMKTTQPFFDTIARRLITTWLAERTAR